MTSCLRVETVTEKDMPRCMDIVLTSFSDVPIQDIMAGPNTPQNRELNGQRHSRGFREHVQSFPSVFPGIKCVYTDPTTGEERIIGFAEWFIWDRERSVEEYMRENYILRLEWVENEEQRSYCLGFMQPMIDARRRLMGGKPFGLLMYMCVDPEYRGMGAGRECVKWGMERCKEVGVPGYLEASEEGKALYERLGWEVLEEVEEGGGVKFPAMGWWPDGVGRESYRL